MTLGLYRQFQDRLERDYVSVMAGQADERRANIGEFSNVLGRRADLALVKVSEKRPRAVAAILGRHLQVDQRYVGAGSQHTVIGEGEVIKKIHRQSVYRNEGFRNQLANQFTAEHHVLRKYFGNFVVAQESYVAAHPLNAKKRAVVSEQAEVIFQPLQLFPAFKSGINLDGLVAAAATTPGITDELHSVATTGIRFFNETGLLLDTSGQHNLVLDVGGTVPELRCLDGLPISGGKAHDIVRIMGQLELLEEYTKAY